jgi:hypothetical protein
MTTSDLIRLAVAADASFLSIQMTTSGLIRLAVAAEASLLLALLIISAFAHD